MPATTATATADCAEILSKLELNEGRFMSLLEKLIGESEFLQNSPPQGLIPCEDKASNHVLAVLEPFMSKNGGVLEVERVSFVEGSYEMVEAF